MDLDERCSNIHAMVFEARCDLFLYSDIGKYATEINKKYGGFFALIQRASLRNLVVTLCKIYEFEGRNELLSIDALCKAIKRTGTIRDRSKLPDDLLKLGICLESPFCEHRTERQVINECVNEVICQITKPPAADDSSRINTLRSGLVHAKRLRDKVLVHAEKVASEIKGPSIHEMDGMLIWAEEFIRFVWNNFTNKSVVAYPNEDAKMASNALKRVLFNLGILEKSSPLDSLAIGTKNPATSPV